MVKLLPRGIIDFLSPGGNDYSNNTFTNIYQRLSIYGLDANMTVVLDGCHFAPPPSN